jgi:hypothetical protein
VLCCAVCCAVPSHPAACAHHRPSSPSRRKVGWMMQRR